MNSVVSRDQLHWLQKVMIFGQDGSRRALTCCFCAFYNTVCVLCICPLRSNVKPRDVSPQQEVEITATSWVICSSCSVWSAGCCMVAFPVSRSPPQCMSCISPYVLMYLTMLPLRLEDPLRHQLRQGWFLALCDSDRVLLSVDVVDVPKQRLSLHVGGGAHHVSALSGRASRLTRLFKRISGF